MHPLLKSKSRLVILASMTIVLQCCCCILPLRFQVNQQRDLRSLTSVYTLSDSGLHGKAKMSRYVAPVSEGISGSEAGVPLVYEVYR